MESRSCPESSLTRPLARPPGFAAGADLRGALPRVEPWSAGVVALSLEPPPDAKRLVNPTGRDIPSASGRKLDGEYILGPWDLKNVDRYKTRYEIFYAVSPETMPDDLPAENPNRGIAMKHAPAGSGVTPSEPIARVAAKRFGEIVRDDFPIDVMVWLDGSESVRTSGVGLAARAVGG